MGDMEVDGAAYVVSDAYQRSVASPGGEGAVLASPPLGLPKPPKPGGPPAMPKDSTTLIPAGSASSVRGKLDQKRVAVLLGLPATGGGESAKVMTDGPVRFQLNYDDEVLDSGGQESQDID